MAGGEHVIKWTRRFTLWCSDVRIRAGKFYVLCSHLKATVSKEVLSC